MNHKIELLEALAQLDEFSPEIVDSTPLNEYSPLDNYLAKKLNIDKKDIVIYIDEFNGSYSTFIAFISNPFEPEIYNFQKIGLKFLPRKSREALTLIDKIMNGSVVYTNIE